MKRSDELISKELRIEIEYHLDGLVEVADAIRIYTQKLKEVFGKDLEQTAYALTELDIELFFHLGFHIKKLRRPFKKLHDRAYKQLEEAEADRRKKAKGSKKGKK